MACIVPRCKRRCSDLHGQQIGTLHCKEVQEQQGGTTGLQRVALPEHVEHVSGDMQGYLNANLTPAGTGSPAGSSCVDTNGRI